MIEKPNFHVLTGGPGVGKTTLLHELERRGERVVAETARAVIREQAASGGRAVPWIDNEAFVRLTAERDMALFDRLAGETRGVFFDRGLMDSWRANGTTPWPELVRALSERRYNRRVFVAPPWAEIYITDAERRQDWPEAERTYHRILSNLDELGYAAIVLPKASVEERARFVIEQAEAGS